MTADQAPGGASKRRPGRPASLSDSQVLRIRELLDGGESQASVAEHFEISVSLVSMIARGVRYPDAPGPLTLRYADKTGTPEDV